MKLLLTLEQLKELKPCTEGFKWYASNIKTENIEEILTILSNHRWDWCRWLFVRLLNDRSNRLLAIYCAELVLPLFEKNYPDDNRPREAIEATKLYLEGKITPEELGLKRRAAYAAYAYAAADAAYAAADAAAAAAYAAYADAAAAAAAADAAYAASRNTITKKIIEKAVELLERE